MPDGFHSPLMDYGESDSEFHLSGGRYIFSPDIDLEQECA